MIRNVIAHGTGTSRIEGHPASPLENVTIEGLVLHVSRDPAAPYESAVNALEVAHAKNIRLERIGVLWGARFPTMAERALLRVGRGLVLDTFTGRQARLDSTDAAVVFQGVDGALVRDCVAPAGTAQFLRLSGDANRDIQQIGNELRAAKIP